MDGRTWASSIYLWEAVVVGDHLVRSRVRRRIHPGAPDLGRRAFDARYRLSCAFAGRTRAVRSRRNPVDADPRFIIGPAVLY
jgi:hypothetical protein